VTQAKETGQAAKTVVVENLSKMWARLRIRSRANARWFINVDVEPQLDKLALQVGTGALEPRFVVYGPDGVLRIKGRPVQAIEHCESLGTVGDIMLLDLGQYALIRKGAIEAAESMHVLFIYNEMTYRWVWRINGAPKDKSALTPYKGTSNTVSPFVVLATRA
jgi:HK97 family phage major capsid protein